MKSTLDRDQLLWIKNSDCMLRVLVYLTIDSSKLKIYPPIRGINDRWEGSANSLQSVFNIRTVHARIINDLSRPISRPNRVVHWRADHRSKVPRWNFHRESTVTGSRNANTTIDDDLRTYANERGPSTRPDIVSIRSSVTLPVHSLRLINR